MEPLCVVCEECALGMSDLRAVNLLRNMTRRAHLQMRQGTTVCKTLQVVVGREPQRQHGGQLLAIWLNSNQVQRSKTDQPEALRSQSEIGFHTST